MPPASPASQRCGADRLPGATTVDPGGHGQAAAQQFEGRLRAAFLHQAQAGNLVEIFQPATRPDALTP
ncbi:hypothetical protein OG589_13710 [Sphaerisporangium sp. NBC_01403]|uniref:hypothetical protein n=1 Tax=Sphaerisporangium sp. NBC_01403 TaxID=2903599 RepID=UPI00324EBFB6